MLGLPTAVFMLTRNVGINFIISSARSTLIIKRLQLHLSIGWRGAGSPAEASFYCFTKPEALRDRF